MALFGWSTKTRVNGKKVLSVEVEHGEPHWSVGKDFISIKVSAEDGKIYSLTLYDNEIFELVTKIQKQPIKYFITHLYMKAEDLIGLQFTSMWFEGIVSVEKVDIEKNSVQVKIARSTDNYHHEDWNLEHTLWGFSKGDYKKLSV